MGIIDKMLGIFETYDSNVKAQRAREIEILDKQYKDACYIAELENVIRILINIRKHLSGLEVIYKRPSYDDRFLAYFLKECKDSIFNDYRDYNGKAFSTISRNNQELLIEYIESLEPSFSRYPENALLILLNNRKIGYVVDYIDNLILQIKNEEKRIM